MKIGIKALRLSAGRTAETGRHRLTPWPGLVLPCFSWDALQALSRTMYGPSVMLLPSPLNFSGLHPKEPPSCARPLVMRRFLTFADPGARNTDMTSKSFIHHLAGR